MCGACKALRVLCEQGLTLANVQSVLFFFDSVQLLENLYKVSKHELCTLKILQIFYSQYKNMYNSVLQ